MKIRCKCGRMAVWVYIPGKDDEHDYCCDNCVPRGCGCEAYSVHYDEFPDIEDYPEGEEGKDYKWIEPGEVYVYLDKYGREYPCCEWLYDEDGFDEDKIEEELDLEEYYENRYNRVKKDK